MATPWTPQSNDISNLSLEHARAILHALCQERNTKAKVLDLARKLKHHETLRQAQASAKPARPLAICVECREAFDPNTSGPRDCFYHPGYLEVDDEGDFWADHDEDCHGKIDTDEMREEFPDGFRWDCCGQTGDAEGCHRGAHRSDQLVSKDGVSVDQYESDEEEDDYNEDEDENEEDEEDEAQVEKGEDPEVVIVEERQVVNKRKADDSFEVSVYAQNAKRDRW
ncbi:hypothetical protein N0V92_004591 [Colletotrichum tropicale]|nr:hypothetical protein N0V92_004591 [Colletotrichum tropicale]